MGLTKLQKTQFSGLDYNNIIEDVINLVKNNPEYNEEWEDFLSSNSARMLTELYAYIADQLATRIDWFVNENFIGTATQKGSIIKILKTIGYDFTLPISSEVDVELSFNKPVGTFELTSPYNSENNKLDVFNLTAKDKNGKTINFEALPFDNVSNKFEYKKSIEIKTGDASEPNLVHNVKFYEGETFVEDFTASTDNNPIFELSSFPVAENSIRVYKKYELDGSITEEELMKVNTFLDKEAQKKRDSLGKEYPIPFKKNVIENNKVEIEFAPSSILTDEDRRLKRGEQIRVFYRVGGGKNGNIAKRSINQKKKMLINEIEAGVGFINVKEGTNGQDSETPEHAAINAPQVIRTANKAVTEDDYEILLNQNNTIIKNKSYGNANFPKNLFEQYGLYIKPLEVWNFILKNKPGWETLKPSRYNDFKWLDLRLENRFNEKYAFRKGAFNSKFSVGDLAIIKSPSEIEWGHRGETNIFKNFVHIPTTQELKGNIKKEGLDSFNDAFKLILTGESSEEEYLKKLKNIGLLNSDITTNECIIDGKKEIFQLLEKSNARYISPVDVSENLDISNSFKFNISVDNYENLLIEFIDDGGGDDIIGPSSIVDQINQEFINIYNNETEPAEGDEVIHKIKVNRQFTDLTVGDELNDLSDRPSELTHNTIFYFKINSDLYSIETENVYGEPTYQTLVEKINNELSFKLHCDTVNTYDEIRNVRETQKMRFLKEGMKVKKGDFLQEDGYIKEVNYYNNKFTIVDDNGDILKATSTNENLEIEIVPYEVSLEIDSGLEYPIFSFKSFAKNPLQPLWVEDGNQEENNLFNELGGFENDVYETGTFSFYKKGYQEFGLNAIISEANGFAEFTKTKEEINNDLTTTVNGDYYFQISVDGGASSEEFITIDNTTDDFDTIITKINEKLPSGVDCIEDPLNNKIKIVSSGSPAESTSISITDVTGNNNLTSVLGAVETLNGTTSPSMELDEKIYKIKINDNIYNINIDAPDMTIDNLKNKINEGLSNSVYFCEEKEGYNSDKWMQDLVIKNDNGGIVELKNIRNEDYSLNEEDDLFLNLSLNKIDLDNYEILEGESWESFRDSFGGGDYSKIAKSFEVDTGYKIKRFLMLMSPSKGESSSILNLKQNVDNNVLDDLFELNESENKCYGYKRITLRTKDDDVFGDLIYEIGDINFLYNIEDIYINYLYTSINQIYVGKYAFNKYSIDDPSWRDIAKRIYNTKYKESGEVDLKNSDFFVRFTKDKADKMSLFAIDNDWEISQTTPAKIESRQLPLIVSTEGADPVLTDNEYKIRISIDNKIAPTGIDITGNGGVDSAYNLYDIANNINEFFKNNVAYENDKTYKNFEFAKVKLVYEAQNDAEVDMYQLSINSAINDNNSNITFKETSYDCTENLFPNLEKRTEYTYEFKAEGDYFVGYDKKTITGDTETGVNEITGFDPEIIDQYDIKEGDRVLETPDVIENCFIKKIEDGKIILNKQAQQNTAGTTFEISNDMMTVNLIDEDNNMPDLDFYFHFIYDKRYIEGIFDGKLDNGVRRPGYQIGELDEDIYNETLSGNKMVSVDHTFKQTKFSTFDIKGNIGYNKIYSEGEISQKVNDALRERFSLENRNYGESVPKSQVLTTVQNVPGVETVNLIYFGKDAELPETNVESQINATFDEILILCEDIYISGKISHGIMFSYDIHTT